jgi:DNA-binding PadR family transcriptional regulator
LDHILTTGKEFRIGWLLFLLSSRLSSSGYGYDLRRELDLRGLVLDPAVMYRTLREMEDRTLIASRWMRSKEGPRRRVYDVTAAGEAELARIASSIEAAREAHDAFLSAYQEHRGEEGRASAGDPA